MDRKTVSGMSMMLLAAVLWGFSGFFSRHIMAFGYDAYDITTVRLVLSVIILFVIILIFDRSALSIHKKDLPIFIFFGFMKLLTDLTLFISQGSVNLSISTTLQMLSPIFVLIITVIVFKAKASPKKLLGIVLSAMGAVLVTGMLFDGGSADSIGLLAGLASGFTYAVYTIGAKISVVRGYSPTGALFWMFLFSAAFSLFFGNPVNVFCESAVHLDLMMYCLGLAILITLAPYWLQVRSMKHLDTNTVNIIGVVEAVVAALVGFAFYGEILTVFNILGMVLVFISIVLMGEESEKNPETI